MTICYFGAYNPSYNRTKVILAGLRELGVTVLECRTELKGFAAYRDLAAQHAALRGKYDALVVGFGEMRFLPVFARLISRKPVIWDALYSIHDNWVFDRKLARPHSLKAYGYWLLDWLGCFASSLVILDTDTNARYFQETFRISKKKFARVLVGADLLVFSPREKETPSRVFEVEFHGKYIPVQGTDVIVRAAKLLEGERVHVTMIGTGQTYVATKRLADELEVQNITFLPFIPQAEVVRYVQNADLCIGLVGDVPRVARAIPNKVYEAAAMARVSANADTPSLREVFTPGVDAIAVRAGDPESLASAIRELKENGNAAAMGEAAYRTFLERSTPKKVAESLLEAVARL